MHVHEKGTNLSKKNNPNCVGGDGGSGFGGRRERTTAASQKIMFLYHKNIYIYICNNRYDYSSAFERFSSRFFIAEQNDRTHARALRRLAHNVSEENGLFEQCQTCVNTNRDIWYLMYGSLVCIPRYLQR